MDDDDIKIFMNKYFNDTVIETFNNLKLGAHKSDLARYCLLYIYGGVYMDIKTELIKPIDEIFDKGDDVFYSVLAIEDLTVYQGIIKTPPRNPLFLYLIKYMIETKNPSDYLEFTIHMYVQIKIDLRKNIKPGLNTGNSGMKYYFFKEICKFYPRCSECHDGCDRYYRCCFVYDNNEKVIKTRRSSYPW
jgi:hypothetical protein